jgi:hypothetical protein
VAERLKETVPHAFEGDGVAFLQTVYKNPTLPLSIRLDAAAKAARFDRLMLSATNMRVIRSLEDLTDEELAALRADARGAGESRAAGRRGAPRNDSALRS